MKIRTDFVTNSSSSSFTVSVSLIDNDGNKTVFQIPWKEDDNEDICIDPESVLHYENLEDLLILLSNSISSWALDNYDAFSDEESYEKYMKEYEKNQKTFIDDSKKHVHSTEDISKIVFRRNYNAFGDGKDCIIANDEKLNKLAEEYTNASRKKKEIAKEKLIDYLNESDADRCKGIFGRRYKDFRYNWSKSTKEIDAIAEAITAQDLDDFETGREVTEVDYQSGEITRYAELDLPIKTKDEDDDS